MRDGAKVLGANVLRGYSKAFEKMGINHSHSAASSKHTLKPWLNTRTLRDGLFSTFSAISMMLELTQAL
jgi:hypothetical protein